MPSETHVPFLVKRRRRSFAVAVPDGAINPQTAPNSDKDFVDKVQHLKNPNYRPDTAIK